MDVATFSATLLLFITFYMKSYNLNKLRRESRKKSGSMKKNYFVCFGTFFFTNHHLFVYSTSSAAVQMDRMEKGNSEKNKLTVICSVSLLYPSISHDV
jgi:hypothetical protein